MDRMRRDIPPAPRHPGAGARLHGVVLATLAALLVCAMVAVSPTAPPDNRTSQVEVLLTMADDLAIRSIDDSCVDMADGPSC